MARLRPICRGSRCTPPASAVTGVPAYVDGRMLDIAADAGVRLVNRDRMWHYTEGLRNWDPIWDNHGIRILPGPSSLWLDAEGKRLALPNSRLLIHQPTSGFQGQSSDIEIHAKEIIDVRQRLDEIIAKHTNQPLEKVAKDTERDYFMSAEEAKEYHIVYRVIEHR